MSAFYLTFDPQAVIILLMIIAGDRNNVLKTVVFQDQIINYDLTHKNIKNINMRIKSNGIIAVSCPRNVSDKDIEKFVLSNADRILKVLKKLESEQSKRAISQNFTDGDIFYIFGDKKKILNITSSKTKAYVLGETLIIEAPAETDSEKKKKAVLNLLKELCNEETADNLEKMDFFFSNEKLERPQISFRKMKTRW